MKMTRVTGWFFLSLFTLPAGAQSAPVTVPVTPKASFWHQKKIVFSDVKPVLGLPQTSSLSHAYCSTDGTTFFEDRSSAGAAAQLKLYEVASSGDVKSLLRMVPKDFNSIAVRDFFAGEHTLVTLLEAAQRDDRDGTLHEIRYFLSVSDHDGDEAGIVPLDVRFRPLKVAVFGSGDILLLGWDEGNLVPQLALLREDGTIREFLDLDIRTLLKPYGAKASLKEKALPSVLDSLQRAAFVPFGAEVLLTFPGTAKALRVLNPVGEDRSIPIELPDGFVLDDVLVSDPGMGRSLVLRASPKRDLRGPTGTTSISTHSQRLFEMDSYHGTLIRELQFDKPRIESLTCAPHSELLAIFYDAVAGRQDAGSSDQSTWNKSTGLVVAAAAR